MNKAFVVPAFFFLPELAIAQSTSETILLTKLRDCATISDAQSRLACFDTLAATQTSPEVMAELSRKEFGLPATKRESGAEVDSITARVTAFGRAPDGRPTIRLDNGQYWELDADDPLLAIGHIVSIKRGALSSFLLTTQHKRLHRVRRLK